jgi:uncharacterized protein (DUF488 family)
VYTLYTYGYAGQHPQQLQSLAESLDALVVDIRFRPRSRSPGWSGPQLQRLLGERYRQLPALGNRNYKSGSIQFVDLESGVRQVGQLLAHRPVILLCACADVSRCHRLQAAESISNRYEVTVKHCQSGEAQP